MLNKKDFTQGLFCFSSNFLSEFYLGLLGCEGENCRKTKSYLLRKEGYLLGEIAKELIALAMMYWCEGNKSDQNVGFTNSDPMLVRAFIKILEDAFTIDKTKLKICLHLHDYHNESEMFTFWSKATEIPLEQFTKTFNKKSFHKYSNKGYKGCAQINYYNAHIARVLLSFAKNFIKLYI